MPYCIVPIFYILLNIVDAFTDYKLKDKVKHKRGALIYMTISVVMFFVFGAFAKTTLTDNIVFPVITRLAFFDPLYLLFIRERLTYEGDKNKPDKSFIDEVEAFLGIPILCLRLIYLLIFVSYLIFSLSV